MSEFIEQLPNDYREAVESAGIDSLEGLVQNWQDAQSALGSSIRVPGPDAGEEARAEFDARLAEKVPGLVRLPAEDDPSAKESFFKALGRPEDPTGYTFGEAEELPYANPNEQAEWKMADKQTQEWVAKIAHGANLTSEQARSIYEGVITDARNNTAEALRARNESMEKLKEDWGESAGQRMAMARHVLSVFGGEEGGKLAEQELNDSGLANNPAIARVLYNIASQLEEDTLVDAGVGDHHISKSASEIEAEIGEMRANKDHALHDPSSPAHRAALDKMRSLYEQLESLRKRVA